MKTNRLPEGVELDFDSLFAEDYTPAFELAPGVTAEEMRAEYFKEDAMLMAPRAVYRLNNNGKRYYYIYDNEGRPRFMQSVTTFLGEQVPIGERLLNWLMEHGKDGSEEIKSDRAYYGTFLHIQLQALTINRTYDFGNLRTRLQDYCESEKLPTGFMDHERELRKDILAYAQFLIDYNVRAIAVEIVLADEETGYAGALDLVCEMDAPAGNGKKVMVPVMVPIHTEDGFDAGMAAALDANGKPIMQIERIDAVIDNKSGRKGFYEEHWYQLECYRRMWCKHFPNRPILRTFNWAPKAWRGAKPTYTLQEQTNRDYRPLDHYIALAQIKAEDKKEIVVIDGVINLDSESGISGNVTEYTLAELVAKRTEEHADENTPDADINVAETVEGENMAPQSDSTPTINEHDVSGTTPYKNNKIAKNG